MTSRLVRMVGFVIVSLVLTGALGSTQTVSAGVRSPDIVLIVTDDQRRDTMAAMPQVRTRLAANGVTFKNGFVVTPLCCPSRASILTGLYPHSTGVYTNVYPGGGFAAFSDQSTLATWLDEAGYETALVGKYINEYTGTYVPPGWDRWVALTDPGGYFDFELNVDGTLESYSEADGVYSTDLLATEAASFVRAATGPLFLYFTPFAPHAPAVPAPRHATEFSGLRPTRPPSYDEADVSDKPEWLQQLPRITAGQQSAIDAFRVDQHRSLLAVDEAIGAILDALAETGRLRNTLVIFTSDNGIAWGEHRWDKKWVPYEEAVRVPLVIRYPGHIPAGAVDSRFALNVDLAATIADAARVVTPPTEGRSLLSLFDQTSGGWRDHFLLEQASRIVPAYCAIRDAASVYVQYKTGEEELYDLALDPYQLENVAASGARRATIANMRTLVQDMCTPPPPDLVPLPRCLLTGSDGDDVVVGTRWFDLICGGSGDDTVWARGGSDTVSVGTGDDVVHAEAGADNVTGYRGRDRLRGGPGNDRLWGGAGIDVVLGEDGADVVKGRLGSDYVAGGAGVDRVAGGPGTDRLFGGAGGDRIYARDSRRDIVRCGTGVDWVSADRVDALFGCELVALP